MKKAQGIRRRVSGPMIIRVIWGIMTPIQPTIPQIQTETAVISVEQVTVSARVRLILTPKAWASESPKARTLSFHRIWSSIPAHRPITGTKSNRSERAIFPKDPINQNVISGRAVSVGAIYFITDNPAEKILEITLPDKTSKRVWFPRSILLHA